MTGVTDCHLSAAKSKDLCTTPEVILFHEQISNRADIVHQDNWVGYGFAKQISSCARLNRGDRYVHETSRLIPSRRRGRSLGVADSIPSAI